VDVTLTLVITGILAGIAVPKFADSLHRYQVESAAAQVQADLAYARQLATSRSNAVTVQFSAASGSYTLLGVDCPDRVGKPYTIQLTEYPHKTKLLAAALGGDEAVEFNAFGIPDSGGTITLQSGAWVQTVTIDPDTGKATGP
jgi:hypothetical protein